MRKSSEANKEGDCMRLSVSLSFASPDWRASFRIAAIVREPEVIAALDKIGAQPASGGTEDLGRAMEGRTAARRQGGGSGWH
jgi:hypothetical protein